jgi:hypothetical protein
MKGRNAAKLLELDEKIKDAEENLGETEVRDAVQAKADYYAQIGDREAAAKVYAETETKTASVATKTDLVFNQIRWGGRAPQEGGAARGGAYDPGVVAAPTPGSQAGSQAVTRARAGG